MAFFGALRANGSKSAENKMSFEIHMTTIANGWLSFGLKNCQVFLGLSFFENVKKPGL